ncbi:hypothetical protein EC912_107103 [Luteibacter rhizovicinus]|uniref:Uncharacterized protein n=1 Tax=Luteibacter rhizovicinus TaxID=242606 RepID=A0A4R3YIB6_9GAMM|nr:hypothetical protein [Luteibacter rhizovicinus]TCV92395.1 hypothetical protein EC912_107103 [Luteibacter rhizovicinus]
MTKRAYEDAYDEGIPYIEASGGDPEDEDEEELNPPDKENDFSGGKQVPEYDQGNLPR